MAESRKGGVARVVRPIILLLVVGGIGWYAWRRAHRQEGYTGGDIVTTGTVEAVHVRLGFKVSGRISEMPVTEGAQVRPGQTVARLDVQDLETQVVAARAALQTAHANLGQAQASRLRASRDWARQRELMRSEATTQQQLDAARATAGV